MRRRGFALIELLVVFAIMSALAAFCLTVLPSARHKARAAVSKGQIASLAQALEQVKDDTGLYPTFLTDLLRQDRPALMPASWRGPYVTAITTDPWQRPYYYIIKPKTLGSTPFPVDRQGGKPHTETFTFNAPPETVGAVPPMPMTVRVENYGITACDISVNGVLVFPEKNFKKNPRPQILEVVVDPQEVNVIEAYGRSQPGESLAITIYQGQPTNDPFTVGSYAADGKTGGAQTAKDIEWYAGAYPNFR